MKIISVQLVSLSSQKINLQFFQHTESVISCASHCILNMVLVAWSYAVATIVSSLNIENLIRLLTTDLKLFIFANHAIINCCCSNKELK